MQSMGRILIIDVSSWITGMGGGGEKEGRMGGRVGGRKGGWGREGRRGGPL